MQKNHKAVILLHEIYGINDFILSKKQEYENIGYDVICPNMLKKESFPYNKMEQAYQYF